MRWNRLLMSVIRVPPLPGKTPANKQSGSKRQSRAGCQGKDLCCLPGKKFRDKQRLTACPAPHTLVVNNQLLLKKADALPLRNSHKGQEGKGAGVRNGRDNGCEKTGQFLDIQN